MRGWFLAGGSAGDGVVTSASGFAGAVQWSIAGVSGAVGRRRGHRRDAH